MNTRYHIEADEIYPDFSVSTPDESSFYGQPNAYLTDEEFAFVDKARGDYAEAQALLRRALDRGLPDDPLGDATDCLDCLGESWERRDGAARWSGPTGVLSSVELLAARGPVSLIPLGEVIGAYPNVRVAK